MILVIGEKGDTGRTTTATHTTCMGALSRRDILLVDANLLATAAMFVALHDGEGYVPAVPCMQSIAAET